MAGPEDSDSVPSESTTASIALAATTAPSSGPGSARSHDPGDPLATLASATNSWNPPDPGDSVIADVPRIGRFVVLREIGRGAMGVVHAAYDDELDRRVALKLVHTGGHDDPTFGRNQLLREAQALARLSHPNVVAVHEAGVCQGPPFHGAVFIAMEFVDGVDLQRWLAAAPRTWREIVDVLRQAGEGLRAAHAVGLVHRDFKPTNVLVGVDGRVRVADFGLATRRGKSGRDFPVSKDIDPSLAATAAAATIANSGALVGTPAYMSPEQLRRETATAASDQFAFCVALYEALYGRRPFVGDNLVALSEQVLHQPPPPPPPDADAPAWLFPLLVRGLAKDPAQRFPTMDELLAQLARDPDAERQRRRQRVLQLVAAVAATLVLALGGVYAYRTAVTAAHEQRAHARLEVLREQLAHLGARGRTDEAARLFAAFISLPDNRGTAALARAFREWGEAQTDDAVAIDAHAGEYIAARSAADQAAALRSLAVRLARTGAIAESAAALAALDARAPELAGGPELAALRVATALDRRDLPAARAALAHLPAGAPDHTYKHVLDHLSHVTFIDRSAIGQRPDARHNFAAADIDADDGLELATIADQRQAAVVLRADPALTRIAELPLPAGASAVKPLPRSLGDEPLLLVSAPGAAGDDRSLLRHSLVPITGGDPVFTWDDSLLHAWTVVDLDGDGRSELYVGSGPYARRLTQIRRDARGQWSARPAHLSTDAARSDINAIVAGDLDGDGRPELVVAAGAWTAYDLRVLRADDQGDLRLVARRSLGFVEDLALVRGGDRPLIAVSKRDFYENPSRFSAANPFGEPAGLYLLALRAGALEVVQHFPSPRPGDSARDFIRLAAVDLDGDGRDDLVASSARDLAVLRHHDARFLDPLWLGGVHLLAAGQFDDDPRGELLVRLVEDRDRYALLGAGRHPLPVLAPPAAAARPIRDDVSDPAIADAWRHAEELAAFGLPGRSAAELAIIARLSEHAREDMLFRSAELHAQAGDHAAAAELFLAAADRPDLAFDALGGAIRSHRARGEFAEAQAIAARRAAAPGLDTGVRADAEAELAALQKATEPRPELALRFDRPLDPRWRIVDPLAVGRDLGEPSLSFQSSPDTLVAELPLEWDGGAAGLAVDFALEHLDWGSELLVAVTPPDSDEPWLAFRFESRGQNERPRHHVSLGTGPTGVDGDVLLDAEPGGITRARVAVHHYPSLGSAVREVTVPGAPPRRTVHGRLPRPPSPGPLRLRLYSRPYAPGTLSHVRIFAIDLVGLRPGAALPDGDDARRREIAHHIAEGEIEHALAQLVELAEPDPKSPRKPPVLKDIPALWQAELLARTGQIDAAAAGLKTALTGLPPEHPLRARLRDRLMRDPDALTLAAQRAIGPELYALFTDPNRRETTWRPERVRFHLADLAAVPLEPPTDPAARRAHLDALYLRGLAWLRAGRDDLAVRDLEALEPLLADPEFAETRNYIRRRLIDAAIRLRDRPRARRWIAAAIAESTTAELLLENIRRRPGIDGLLDNADWSRFENLVGR